MSENEPRTVWAVTSGEYSDYRVMALFEREEDAQRAVQDLNLGDDVTAFRLHPADVMPKKVGYWRAGARVNADGTMADVASGGRQIWVRADEDWTSSAYFVVPKRPQVSVVDVQYSRTDPRVAYYNIQAEAMTEEAATKAVSDAVANLRSELMEPRP